MATVAGCSAQDWTCLFSEEFSTELQFSQYQHQNTPVPSTDKVCSALRYRNIDPLSRRNEYTGGLPHEMSATDTWYTLVDSCLQYRGASAIWFVNHWYLVTFYVIDAYLCLAILHAWTLEYTSTWCSVSDGGYLRRQKGQLEKSAGSPSQRLAQQVSGGCQRSTAISTLWRSEIARGHWGAQLFTRTTRRRRWWWRMTCVKKWRVKEILRHLQVVRNRDCWVFENHWRRVLSETVWRRGRPKCIFHFRPNENADENEISFSAEKTKTKTKVTFVYITELSYGSVANVTFSAQSKWHFWNENEK